ncbi:MFS transporter [Dongia sedimenti]|uniref:MFS transporter n=1 Tax=Dongia sedimenti TaxID=3064282 RepID=A0ABU0YFW6_9PROT|nr:MFS transporter [Rhodospirillaceae bacterium R-7]
MSTDSLPPALSRSVLKYRDYRLFLLARLLVTAAIQIQSVAVGYQVYEITSDPLQLGFVGLAQFLPMLALILPAGDLADRFNRRTILLLSCLLEAVVAAAFFALTVFKVEALWAFYLVLALFGVVRTLSAPAGQSLVPLLVPPEHLSKAIAWSSSAFQTATIVGPALGGGLYAVLGPEAAYSICFVLALLVAVLFGMMRVSMAPRDIKNSTAFQRAVAGIDYVKAHPIILGAISLDLFAVLLGGATALLPVYAKDILQVGAFGNGLLRTAPAIGAAVTGLWLGYRPLNQKTGAWMFGCVALFGVATVVFGLSENFVVSFVALIVLGASDMVSVFVRSTLIQAATPDAMRGRVSAVSMLFVGASNELGEFESGGAAHLVGTVPAVVIGGLGTLGVVGLWMWLFPALRKVDRLSDVKAGEEYRSA